MELVVKDRKTEIWLVTKSREDHRLWCGRHVDSVAYSGHAREVTTVGMPCKM